MAGLIGKLMQLSRTPQGKKAIESARQAAQDPKKQAQAKELLGRFKGRR